ncbi:MAG: hypothetical protein HFE77_08090 [Clostridiales bacterium]|nr:hypothetical protein [Clostridiales bacterium]
MSKMMDLSKGMLLGAAAGLSVGFLVASDKRKKKRIVKAAKRTMEAVEDTVKNAVDMTKHSS